MNINSYYRVFSYPTQQKYNARACHEYDILVRGNKCVRGMIHMNLVAQAIGMVGMLLVFISYQINDRRRMLNYQIAISLIWVAHFYLLGAYAAAGINLICVGRAVVFYFRGKYHWANLPVIPAIFCLLNLGSTLFTWTGPMDILAVSGAALQTIGLWMREPRKIRWIMMSSTPFWIAYDILNHSYVGIATELIALASILVAVWRFDIRHRRQ